MTNKNIHSHTHNWHNEREDKSFYCVYKQRRNKKKYFSSHWAGSACECKESKQIEMNSVLFLCSLDIFRFWRIESLRQVCMDQWLGFMVILYTYFKYTTGVNRFEASKIGTINCTLRVSHELRFVIVLSLGYHWFTNRFFLCNSAMNRIEACNVCRSFVCDRLKCMNHRVRLKRFRKIRISI